MVTRAASLLCAALAWAGCAPREIPYRVELVTTTCGGASVLTGVTHLRFRITATDLPEPLERVTPVTARYAELPAIPSGRARTLEVRGYDGDPTAGGRVRALGRTLPFDVAEVMPLPGGEPDTTVVFLRPVDQLVPANLSVSPSTCTRPVVPRAAHTATALPDGRVLLAGGYRFGAGGAPEALAAAELFDPRTGVFSEAPPMGPTTGGSVSPTPRAHHTATLLSDGRVVLAGGEAYDAAGTAEPLSTLLVYDPARTTHAFAATTLPAARSRHAAAADLQGRVLLVGGVGPGGALAGGLDWFDPSTGQTGTSDERISRTGVAAISLPTGEIAIAGGQVGSALTALVQFFSWDGRQFGSTLVPTVMRAPRRDAAIAPYGPDRRPLVIGGSASIDTEPLDPLATTELLDPAGAAVSDGPNISARAGVCAVALPDGRVVTFGGRVVDLEGEAQPATTVEVIQPTSTGVGAVLAASPLAVARSQHTCTLLGDGTVLVTGGLSGPPAAPTALQDAYLFTPAPLD